MTTPATPRPIDPVVPYHEAGHVVAALRRGWWIRAVTLSPRVPGWDGCCELSSSWEEDVQADPLGFLVYTFAGAAAEKRLTGRVSPGCVGDRELASAFASRFHGGADAQDPRVLRTLRTCAVLADCLMWDPTVWREVEHIAPALRQRRTLTGGDIQRLLRSAAKARR